MYDLAGLPTFETAAREEIAPADVHVWIMDISEAEAAPGGLAHLEGVLDEDETARLAKMGGKTQRRRFVAGRALLRDVLSRYNGCDPREHRFRVFGNGKIRLSEAQNPNNITFNLSYGGDHAVLTVGNDRVIGIDIEDMARDADMSLISERFFSVPERAQLCRSQIADRPACFFRLWTLKEAYIKARAQGFWTRLDEMAFDVADNGFIRFSRHFSDQPDTKKWNFFQFDGPSDTILALCVDVGTCARVHLDVRTCQPFSDWQHFAPARVGRSQPWAPSANA